MADSQKTTIIAIVAVLAVALLGFMVFKFMSGSDVDHSAANTEVRKAADAAAAAAPSTTTNNTPDPAAATLPPGKGRHR